MLTDRDREDDILYLAACRPAMIAGVPLQGLLGIGMSALMLNIFLGLGMLLPSIFVGGVFYLVLRDQYSRDFSIMSILQVWLLTRGLGPSTLDPLPQAPRTVLQKALHHV